LEQTDQDEAVGTNVERVDGLEKVTGRAVYGSDIELDSLLHGAILTSDQSHGRITEIEIEDALNIDGVECVLPRTELKGKFDNHIRHYGDVIAAVAADSPETAQVALGQIAYSIDSIEPIYDATEAAAETAPTIHKKNTPLGTFLRRHEFSADEKYNKNVDDYHELDVGDVDAGFEQADILYESSYVSPRVDHCNLDTHCAIAEWENDELTIIETIASPRHGEDIISEFIDIDVDRITIETPPVASSSFGGRSLPKITLEPVVASLAKETDCPVKLWFSRQEEFVSTSSRHRTHYTIKTGVTNDGDIIAMELNAIADTGGYPNGVGHIVLTNSENRPLDLYQIPNYRYEGVSVFTNNIPGGEYRGIGSTQLMFALESHIDEIAHQIEIDPIEFRQRNFVEEGYERPHTGQEIESCGLSECLERGQTTFNQLKQGDSDDLSTVTGTGVAAGAHTTAAGARSTDSTRVMLTLDEEGILRAYNSSIDIGQGSETVLTQILTQESGIPMSNIKLLAHPKEGKVEDMLGSVASRTTYIIGAAMRGGGKKLKQKIKSIAATHFDVDETDVELQDGSVQTISGETIPVGDLLAVTEGTIEITERAESALNPPGYGVHFAEVEIDTETGDIDVQTYVAGQDVGFAINPKLIEGQIEGAVLHGIEFALYSEVKFDSGRPTNTNLADYPAISPWEMPDRMVCEIIESNEETGPYGAKGVGTPVMTPIAPAILNAIRDAIGVRFENPPVHSEDVFLAVQSD
jgi:CO/xanthine dehydrogenase Mo-binding subunit